MVAFTGDCFDEKGATGGGNRMAEGGSEEIRTLREEFEPVEREENVLKEQKEIESLRRKSAEKKKAIKKLKEAHGSADTGLAKFAMQKSWEVGVKKDETRTKAAYTKLAMTDVGVVGVVSREKSGSTRSLFSRRLGSKLAGGGGRRGTTPTLLMVKKASDSIDSGTDVRSPTEYDGPNFDLLFESPDKYPMGLRTPKCLSPSTTMDDFPDVDVEANTWDVAHIKDIGRSESDEQYTVSKLQMSRKNSVMEMTLTQILAKHYHSSGGLAGFRRRVANDIRQKYCSFCRCDDVFFLFLYVLFGIVYISAGTLGVLHCPDESTVAYYLLADGFLSVFVFPITIVEWTRRIGGCINENEKVDRGILFVAIVTLRVAAAVTGTAILLLITQKSSKSELFCHTVHVLLEVGVVTEWAFLLLVIVLPLCLYGCGYIVAKSCL